MRPHTNHDQVVRRDHEDELAAGARHVVGFSRHEEHAVPLIQKPAP